METGIQTVKISKISLSVETQVRDYVVFADTLDRYRRVMDEGGTLDPVDTFWDGSTLWLGDGFHRRQVHIDRELDEIETNVREGGKLDAIFWGLLRNGKNGRPLTRAEVRRTVRRIIEIEPTLTVREIVEKSNGVATNYTVRNVRRLMDRENGVDAMTSEIAPSRPAVTIDLEDLCDPAIDLAASVTTSEPTWENGPAERGTPKELAKVPHYVMGGVDLDPCSTTEFNLTVRAKKFYDASADGLAHPWPGKVWLHPPAGREADFIAHLQRNVEDGTTTQAMVLVTPKTQNVVWQDWLLGQSVCFIRGRLRLDDPEASGAAASETAHALIYIGPRVEAFTRICLYNETSRRGLGRVFLNRGDTASGMRKKERSLCQFCGVPCSSGLACPTCKQTKGRNDRSWKYALADEARAIAAKGGDLLGRTASLASKHGVAHYRVCKYLAGAQIDGIELSAAQKAELRSRVRESGR